MTKTLEEMKKTFDERNALMKVWQANADKLWDSVRLPLFDLYFEGNVTRAQVNAVRKLFNRGFAKVASEYTDAADQADVVVDFEVKVLNKTWRKPGKVSVVLYFNRKGWEGTYASIFCGARGHFFIGVRGGIEACRGKGSKKDLQRAPEIFGWEN